jgi:hypothetical protein
VQSHGPRKYRRRKPEDTDLYEVVRDNLATLYGAIDDGALTARLPKHARDELTAYLDCGLLCRGFARVVCNACPKTHLVAFSCKGRGFCPSCTGRRMCQTAAHLVDDVLPEVALRQWVLTFPFAWRARLANDGELLSRLSATFVRTVMRVYTKRAGKGAKTGAITVVQRTSSDMRLNPHLHVLFLDGAYTEEGAGLTWHARSRLTAAEVAEALGKTIRKMERAVARWAGESEESELTASAVSGQTPPAGPQWKREMPALQPQAPTVEKPLCVAQDGFTLHAATRAGGADKEGREALLRYVLRPPIAQERVTLRDDGLVRITLKRAYGDGTVAVDMDPLSLLCRLAAAVPPPRHHVVKYAGVLASASPLRARIAPVKEAVEADADAKGKRDDDDTPKRGAYRGWAELLSRTFAIDVLQCPDCGGRMKLLAVVTEAKRVRRYLEKVGERTDVPEPSPARGPPYWKSAVLRRKAGDVAAA